MREKQEFKYLGSTVQSSREFVKGLLGFMWNSGTEEKKEEGSRDLNVQLQRETDDWLRRSLKSKEEEDTKLKLSTSSIWKMMKDSWYCSFFNGQRAILSALAVVESAFVPNNRTLTRGGYFGPFIAASWCSVFVRDTALERLGHWRT